jgi:peptidoglycan hydrolase-like protein with peptidoglycan-binding domain
MKSTPRPRDPARWLTPSVAMVAAVVIGFSARNLWPKSAGQPAVSAAVQVSVAQVVRTDVALRQVVSGTLGYQGSYSVVSELPAGVITWLPGPGQVITRGHALYRLADQAVFLCYGQVPAWRDIGPGMTPGPDVRELDANLNALGFQAGPPSDTFTWATEAAIERWQLALGLPETGTVPLGGIVFLPGPLRVAAVDANVTAGADIAPGTQVLTGSSTQPAVSVDLTPGGRAVRPGDQALVTMPDGTTMPGTVSAVGGVTTAPAAQGQAAQGQAGTSAAAIPVTIRLAGYPGALDQAPVQVTITAQEDTNVLAVPVTALLAQPGGRYAVRTASSQGHRLIPVAIGLYDDETGLVEVSGAGLAPGLRVEVAQG